MPLMCPGRVGTRRERPPRKPLSIVPVPVLLCEEAHRRGASSRVPVRVWRGLCVSGGACEYLALPVSGRRWFGLHSTWGERVAS